MEPASYEAVSQRICDLPLHTKKNPFETAKAFYEWLGEPGQKSRIFHVAGTNGKGSVCAFLHSILTKAGYRTGMFTSPHLVELRERLVLDQAKIKKETFTRLYEKLRERLRAFSIPYEPTFFETLYFLFMLWMEEEKPDFIILETGMGGRLDVTNTVSRPLVCVVTRIALDHCEYLGDTKRDIAAEKAGIFKPGAAAVCLDTEQEVRSVFVERARELDIPLTLVSKKRVAFSKLRKNSVDFFMKSAYYKYIEASLKTNALYQAENALMAVRALEAAGLSGQIAKEQVESGLAAMRWEGRMEEVLPDVFVDGAHNPDGIAAFLQSVSLDGGTKSRYLLFGACADKSVKGMWELLQRSGLFAKTAGSCIQNPRSLTRQAFLALPFWGGAAVYEDSADALFDLMQKKGPNDRIYVTGSLYLVGEIKQAADIYMEEHHDQF